MHKVFEVSEVFVTHWNKENDTQRDFVCREQKCFNHAHATRVAYITNLAIYFLMKRGMSWLKNSTTPKIDEIFLIFLRCTWKIHGKIFDSGKFQSHKHRQEPHLPNYAFSSYACTHFPATENWCFSFLLHLVSMARGKEALTLWKYLEHRSAMRGNIDKMRHRKGNEKACSWIIWLLFFFELFLVLLMFTIVHTANVLHETRIKGAEKTIILYWIFDEEIKNVCRNWYCVEVKKL